jgi:hypothetical protein
LTIKFDSQSTNTPTFSQSCARKFPKKLFEKLVYKLGPVIPGLASGAVPQGLAYSANHGMFLITAYLDNGTPSQLFFIDEKSGKLQKSFSLYQKLGTPLLGHVGGVATDGKIVWIASDGYLYTYQPFDLIYPKISSETIIVAIDIVETETLADYVTFYDGVIYVGEFYLQDKQSTKPSHHLKNQDGKEFLGWLCGYRNGKIEHIFATRSKVQGAAFSKDKIYLSISYGRDVPSQIEIYNNPLNNTPHTTIHFGSNNREIKVWFLDDNILDGTIEFPPMAEGIALDAEKLTVLVESGAEKYQQNGLGPVDYLIHLPLNNIHFE